ncbi:MAG: ABC transporter permease [Eubacteriales bacterium]|nr:ABC transporter permease [Eubacteriales bacterium]
MNIDKHGFNHEKLPESSFEFVQADAKLQDKELETKPVSYLQDAFNRFKRNKASVVAAVIILILVLYAIIAPLFSNFTVAFREPYYRRTLPKSKLLAPLGIWDGTSKDTLNEIRYDYYRGIEEETGTKPIKDVLLKRKITKRRGKTKTTSYYYEVEMDDYASLGIIFQNFTQDQFTKLCKWQDETGIQVIYPAIDTRQQDPFVPNSIKDDPNIWYKVNAKGIADLDKDGKFQPIYKQGNPEDYTSLRVPFDDGTLSYFQKTQTGYTVRVLYSNYYRYRYSNSVISLSEDRSNDTYLVGPEASFLFGTNQYGQDIFTCLAAGARFSFMLAILVSILNLSIGAFVGAMEGYYGGTFDIIMERIIEILGGVPFMITVTLFQLHLAKKVGPAVSLLFAFVLTGWIGMSSLTRTQFYRFKHQEYVLSARTLGATDRRIIWKHIFPNAIGTIITSVVLIIPGVIFSESTLSYLGIVDLSSSTTTSVGTLLAGGQAYLQDYPHIIFFPALFIALLQISFNLFGNGLRDAFNPSMRGAE